MPCGGFSGVIIAAFTPLALMAKLAPYEIGVPLGAGAVFKEAYGQEPGKSDFPITSL